MAQILKTRARNAIVEGKISHGWHNSPAHGKGYEQFTLSIGDVIIYMSRAEARSVCDTLREDLSNPELKKAAGLEASS